MPTRSRRTKAPWSAPLLALAAAGALAHEPGADALPETDGYRVGASVAGVLPAANERWPVAAWPGALITGSAPPDQRRGLRLEHATLDLATRLNERWGAHLAAGWHDRDAAHVEAASLQHRFALGDGDLQVRAGRDTVRLGSVIDSAGHFDRFSQPPLAKRAVLNDQWIDDGLSIAWRRADADGIRALEGGLWRGRVFPGGASGPAVPSVHLHAGWGHVDIHLMAARFQPRGRGAAAQSLGSVGHVHGALDCSASLQQRVCFDGNVDVMGGSVQWEPARGDWTFALAGLARREQGSLVSTSGDAALRSRVSGFWADAVWRPAAGWSLAARLERLAPSNRIEGVGAALLARDAGLANGGPVTRATLAVLHEPVAGLQLSLEGGRERYAGGRVSHIALRAVWRNPRLLGGAW